MVRRRQHGGTVLEMRRWMARIGTNRLLLWSLLAWLLLLLLLLLLWRLLAYLC